VKERFAIDSIAATIAAVTRADKGSWTVKASLIVPESSKLEHELAMTTRYDYSIFPHLADRAYTHFGRHPADRYYPT